ncbi:MAG: hypothetical protein COB71_11035 [Thiotrichales bacterium]|nr:MAG: hypothetical protein COB71_11035 [Thiotrichales bacterium]
MNTLQDEYYIIRRANNDNYPLFSWDQSSGQFGMGKPVEVKGPVKMRLGNPISPHFEWVDYHVVPDPVVSPLIADALASLDLHGVQLVPAVVRHPKETGPFPEVHDYWFVHVWHRIHCLDREKSEIEYYDGDKIFGIDKLVLDVKTLGMFELRKRLVFELAEKTSVLLVHESIKDAIEAVKPKGCRFFRATDWNSDCTFD